MAKLREYKCPDCGGPMEWNAAVRKMKCPYCDSEYTVQELNEKLNFGGETETSGQTSPEEISSDFDDLTWENNSGYFSDEETAGMRVYSCVSCGAQLLAPETSGSMTCPYCSNNVVMTGQFTGDLKPERIIPFLKDKKAAKEALKKHVNSRRFVPRVFKEENHIDEIKAIYVPYWLFDAKAEVTALFEASRVSTRRSGNVEYTDTAHYRLQRGGGMNFDKVPVDASRNIADDLMESIEPFDFNEAVPFDMAYLAGFLADRYDVSAQECEDKAYRRMENSANQTVQSSLGGYTNVRTLQYDIHFTEGRTTYALYPVWILNTTWQDKKYIFAMNGQTGKFVGDLQLDKKDYYKSWAVLAAVLGVMIYGIMWLMTFL